MEENGDLTTLEFLVEEHAKFGYKYINKDFDDYNFRYFYHTSNNIKKVNYKYIAGAINIHYGTKKIDDKIYSGPDLQNIYYDIDGKSYRFINGEMRLRPLKKDITVQPSQKDITAEKSTTNKYPKTPGSKRL